MPEVGLHRKKFPYNGRANPPGALVERLYSGLQSRGERFDSAGCLQKNAKRSVRKDGAFLVFSNVDPTESNGGSSEPWMDFLRTGNGLASEEGVPSMARPTRPVSRSGAGRRSVRERRLWISTIAFS